MTIKQKIHCVMLLSVALGLALGLIFSVAQRNVDAANAQEQDLSNISKSIFQLTLIGQDVSLHPNEFRARSQWLKQHRELGDMLRKIHIDAPQDNTVLERLRNAHKNQLRLFEMLRLLPPQQRETGAAEIAREQQESLIHRMSFGVQEMLSDAISLERRKQVKTADYRRKVDVIALSLAGIMTTAIAMLAYLIGRSIITPLVRLRQETEIVGSGNLDHRVGTSANDELGELSRDFDRMLERLQQVTTSREALQREIEIRTNAEHSLRKSEQSLKKAQSIARLGSWEWDIRTGQLTWSDEAYNIFGRSPEQLPNTYEALLDAVYPDDRPLVAYSVKKALQDKGYDIEHRIRRPDGEIRIVHEIGEVEFDDAGKPVRLLGTIHSDMSTPVKILGTVHDITERKHVEDELRRANERLGAQLLEIEKLQSSLREQAIRDPLTGLFNRRYMEETLEREFSGAERENYPVSLVMLDIDHFKKINDTYGHPAGDAVLRALSALLSGHIRGRDIACRYGGEEFLAVLPHTPIETATQRAELWRAAFEALQMTHEGKEIRATISLGVAAFAVHGATGKMVLSSADKALYMAKENGRNRVIVAPRVPD